MQGQIIPNIYCIETSMMEVLQSLFSYCETLYLSKAFSISDQIAMQYQKSRYIQVNNPIKVWMQSDLLNNLTGSPILWHIRFIRGFIALYNPEQVKRQVLFKHYIGIFLKQGGYQRSFLYFPLP